MLLFVLSVIDDMGRNSNQGLKQFSLRISVPLLHWIMASGVVDETANACLSLIFCVLHCGNLRPFPIALWNLIALCLESCFSFLLLGSYRLLKYEGLMLLFIPGKTFALIYLKISPLICSPSPPGTPVGQML